MISSLGQRASISARSAFFASIRRSTPYSATRR
jgi:hypothetical protein